MISDLDKVLTTIGPDNMLGIAGHAEIEIASSRLVFMLFLKICCRVATGILHKYGYCHMSKMWFVVCGLMGKCRGPDAPRV